MASPLLSHLNTNPVTGRPSTFDGMPRSTFFAKNAGKTGGSVPVYNDIRQAMAGQPVQPDPRSFGAGGQNFMGPPIPPILNAQTSQPVSMRSMPPMRPSTGMLVPSSMGGVKWQPGTGPGTTLPPQSGGAMPMPPPMRPNLPTMPFAMPAQRAAYVNTGSGLDRAVSTGLAGAPRRQVGRSANDITRIAERMRRQGDPRAIMQLGQMQIGQDFARERDAVNFAQGQMMFNQQQQAMDARDARNFDQGLTMFELQQDAINQRDAMNFAQQQQMEQARRAAELADQEAARSRVPNLQMMPIPGTSYTMPIADGKPMGTLPMQKPDAPIPAGLVPTQVTRGDITYRLPEAPKPAAPRAPQVRRIINAAGQEVDAQWNPQTNQWEPVAMAGGSATSVAAGGNVPPSPTTGKTASGISFTLK